MRTNAQVVHIDNQSVRVMIGDREETWPTRTALWAAGVGVELRRGGGQGWGQRKTEQEKSCVSRT